MKKRIAYLHNHTVYSEADGIATHEDYAKKIKEFKEEGVDVVGFATTEHGVMYSYIKGEKFISPTTKHIVGLEAYTCIDRIIADKKERSHLILLAKNQTGLRNLYHLATEAGFNKANQKKTVDTVKKEFPRLDHKDLERYGKGIIATSACLGGLIPQLILNGEYEEAKKVALYYKKIFEDFYLEVQPHTMADQLVVNSDLVKMSQETGIGLVISTDSHYIEKETKKAHNILMKINHYQETECYSHLQSYDEIYNYCIEYNIPLSAIENTVVIAESCNVEVKPKQKKGLLPSFPCPKGYTENAYLKALCNKYFYKYAMKKGFKDLNVRKKRLLEELDVICSTGFSAYFLILWDWYKWCKDEGILLGKGRGSAASSIVAYLLGITSIDPIEHNFLFSRFLNVERLDYPDVDSDISKLDRARGIKYLLNKYGNDYVSQIISFAEYNLKNTFKAAMSALVPDSYQEANAITKMIPNTIDGNTPTYKLMMKVYENQEKYENLGPEVINQIVKSINALEECFNRYPEVYQAVLTLKGCIAGSGIHAGGVIISSKPLADYVPLIQGSDTAVLPLIQIEMEDVDYIKLLKIDALGLSNLSQVDIAMKLIGLDRDWFDNEDFNDPKVYEMILKNETTDLFQIASPAATKLYLEMKCSNFYEMMIHNAGNRPGPRAINPDTGKSMCDLYIERKRTGIVPSIEPRIDEILKPTLGCIFFQEQAQQLGTVMAGYSLAMADLRIRKVVAKKRLKEIPVVRNEFIYGKKSLFNEDGEVIGVSEEDCGICIGAVRNGFTLEVAEQIFDTIEEFAKYAFNIAHKLMWAGYRNIA